MHRNPHVDHHWQPRSTHRTSEGLLRYETCACGAWRFTVRPFARQVVVTAGGQDRQTGATSRR